jgi:DNA-binding transcriptional ArsR family regulator
MTAPAPSASLDLVFAALSDPTRRAILGRLARGEASVTELVAPFELSQPTISKHLKVLERAGLISRGRDAQFRPCRLNAAPLEQADMWIAAYRRFWETQLDQLERYVRTLHQNELQERPPKASDPKTRGHKKSERKKKEKAHAKERKRKRNNR